MVKICIIQDCNRKVHARDFCKSHYNKYTGVNKRRWQKVKNDPELLEQARIAKKSYYESARGKANKRKRDKCYYRKHKDKINKYKKKWSNSTRFGGKREMVIERDGFKCAWCGMSRHAHKIKWKCDLHVDHMDGLGRAVSKEERNNDPKNLITLCRSCHMKKGIRSGEISKE